MEDKSQHKPPLRSHHVTAIDRQQFTTCPTVQSQALETFKTCAVCYFRGSLLSDWYVPWKASNHCTMPIVTWSYRMTFIAFARRAALIAAGLYYNPVFQRVTKEVLLSTSKRHTSLNRAQNAVREDLEKPIFTMKKWMMKRTDS